MRSTLTERTNPTHRTDRLVTGLSQRLAEVYGHGATPANGTHPMQEAFAEFGAGCAAEGVSLEEAMAAAVETLRDLLQRLGAPSSDPATTIAAGIALAAVARSHGDALDASRQEIDTGQAAIQVARLDALHQINRATANHPHIAEILDISVQAITRSTHSDACSISLYDPATDLLTLRAASGLNPSAIGAVSFPASVGITGRALRERRPVMASDAHRDELFFNPVTTGEGVYTSQLSIPVFGPAGDVPVGAINLYSVRRREFGDDEIAFLETVAGELAMTIENVRMRNVTDATLRRKVDELGTLQRLTRLLASSLDLPQLLKLITEAAVELIDAEAAAIFRVPRHTTGSSEPVPTIEVRTGQAREVLDQTRRESLIRNVIEYGSAQVSEMDYVDGMQALFCLPLRSARETWGALCLRLKPGVSLSDDELSLLQAFTDSASLAIENAQLYREATQSADTASTLLQEMHHRVRNNLQTVAALLSIQMRQTPDDMLAGSLREAISRIQAIASVHDLLSDEQRLRGTTIDDIARLVTDEARTTLFPSGTEIGIQIDGGQIALPSRQATVLALILNELVANAVTHGFEGRQAGNLSVRAHRLGDFVSIRVSNDGHAVDPGFDPSQSSGLGMRIVQRLVTSDLQGSFSILPTPEGTKVTIMFPLPAEPAPAG